MRRVIFVLTVIATAVVIGTSAVAYANHSDKKKTSPQTTTSPEPTSSRENNTLSETTGPITAENHAWDEYHWTTTAIPVTLNLGDNVGHNWDSYLDAAISDWNRSDVLSATKVEGGANPKRCRATPGQVEVCNAKYGEKGWLGLTSIWPSGEHITQATTKLNDTYFNTDVYDTPTWRNLVMCHEVGHTFGLAHQDEDFENGNLGTCLDYTNDPETNQHPNQHDYEQLEMIYDHTDGSTTVGQTSTGDENEPGDDPRAWGREIFRSSDGRESIYEKELGQGKKKVTHVLWTLEKAAQHRGGHDEDHDHQEE